MALRQDLHSLAGPYALDALDSGAEQDRFERHLNRCNSCTSEVRGFRETATRLGMAVARRPPPELRARVMAAVARTRQLPAGDDRARHARPAQRQRRPVARLAWAGAAISLAAALVLAVVLVNTENQLGKARQQLTQAEAQLEAITAVRTAVDAKEITKPTSAGGTVTVVSSHSLHQMVLTTSGLPPLPAGKVYQLWLIGGPHTHNPIRAEGLLGAPRSGRTTSQLISGVLPADIFGVTVEPTGGTAQPTTKPIVLIALPA
jgi:anti-sigma-K factor RskA